MIIQKPRRRHYKSCIYITQMLTDTPQLLNHVKKIHRTELWIYPSYFVISESLLCWFQGNFAAMFVLNYWLRGPLLSALPNRFELMCEPRHLMLLCYKICPCCCPYCVPVPVISTNDLVRASRRFSITILGPCFPAWLMSITLGTNK